MPVSANAVQVQSSLFDFEVDFLLKSAGDLPPQLVASVPVSPQLAKVLGLILQKQVTGYEGQVGSEIHIPPDALKTMGLAEASE